MIKELVQFTAHLPEDVKKAGIVPKEGLHILLDICGENNQLSVDIKKPRYEIYNKPKPKENNELSSFLSDCAMRSNHAWCNGTNKCFDNPTKAIHSCSPYCVAFKREHLKGGEKYKANAQKKKKQLYDRLGDYFQKAFLLFASEEDKLKFEFFSSFFNPDNATGFDSLLSKVIKKNREKTQEIEARIQADKEKMQTETNPHKKEDLKERIALYENDKKKYRELTDSDYIIFYINLPIEKYKEVHEVYLKNNLFNTSKYDVASADKTITYGTSNFYNGFNANMPFLLHQTATFDISSRISSYEANELYQFEQILTRSFIPNPLPVFIYKEELEEAMITIFKKNIKRGERRGYQEIIKELTTNEKYERDISDYYLLFHQNTKDGIVFNDFDFVTKFEYRLKDEIKKTNYWQIYNLFDLKEKRDITEKAAIKHYHKLYHVFDLEGSVFNIVLGNKYKKMPHYFNDPDRKDYAQFDFTLIAARKYKRAVYDYIYKSRRQAISGIAWKEILLSGLKDDLKHGREYGIKEKLNIWFSLNHHFDPLNINFNNYYMPDKLDQVMKKMMAIADSPERVPIEDEYEFAFISGQLISFILNKSESANNSYSLLEAFLQKTDVSLFKNEIVKYFKRYLHAINEHGDNGRFGRLMREVMGFDKNMNMQDMMAIVLCGYFSNTFYYTKKTNHPS